MIPTTPFGMLKCANPLALMARVASERHGSRSHTSVASRVRCLTPLSSRQVLLVMTQNYKMLFVQDGSLRCCIICNILKIDFDSLSLVAHVD